MREEKGRGEDSAVVKCVDQQRPITKWITHQTEFESEGRGRKVGKDEGKEGKEKEGRRRGTVVFWRLKANSVRRFFK